MHCVYLLNNKMQAFLNYSVLSELVSQEQLKLLTKWKLLALLVLKIIKICVLYLLLNKNLKNALARIQKERREAVACGVTERAWVSLFREYENIEELNRRAMMALVDRIIVYENHVVEIEYKYRDEYEQATRYVSMYREDMAKAV